MDGASRRSRSGTDVPYLAILVFFCLLGLVSGTAQRAAPRIATLMGKPPAFEARAPGQVAAGVNAPPPFEPPAQSAAASGAAPSAAAQTPPANPRQVKVMVAPVEGAPSD